MAAKPWRVANSLGILLRQLNETYPGRSKASDGSIGNAEHSARDSDHNPDTDGVVKARDFTHDPLHGLNSRHLAEKLLKSRDKRIKYIIANREIASGDAGPAPWTWRKYNGKNPHDHHVHVSVKKQAKFFDDTTAWSLGAAMAPVPSAPVQKEYILLMQGSAGQEVERLQKLLKFTGKDVDGDFGPKTRDAVIEFQRSHELEDDGRVGAYTWRALEAQ